MSDHAGHLGEQPRDWTEAEQEQEVAWKTELWPNRITKTHGLSPEATGKQVTWSPGHTSATPECAL